MQLAPREPAVLLMLFMLFLLLLLLPLLPQYLSLLLIPLLDALPSSAPAPAPFSGVCTASERGPAAP